MKGDSNSAQQSWEISRGPYRSVIAIMAIKYVSHVSVNHFEIWLKHCRYNFPSKQKSILSIILSLLNVYRHDRKDKARLMFDIFLNIYKFG